MSSVQVKTEIAATPAEVYNVLMDFASYPDWNPMVVSITGQPKEGQHIQTMVKVGDRAPQKFRPVVLKNEPNREFRWVGALFTTLLYRGEHYFIIEETPAGCTFVHGEIFSGFLEPLITMMLKDDLEPTFRSFNLALKRRVEEQN